MLIKPFVAPVNSSGIAVVTVTHSLSQLVWKVYQLGIGLGLSAINAQVAAHVNGVPLAATVQMQPSVFANIPSQSPYAMESFMVGPPYILLSSGDMLVVGVQNAVSGDTLTVAAYVDENDVNTPMSMGI